MSFTDNEISRFIEEQNKEVLSAVELATQQISEFNNIDNVEISYEQFLRVGLPIIHGIFKGEIHHGAWLQFIGGVNQTTNIIKDGQVYLRIPQIMASVPTNTYQDIEAPTFFSFVGELNLNRQDSPEMWEMAVSQRLKSSFAEMAPDAKFFFLMNELFKENGMSEIPVEEFVAPPAEGEATSETKLIGETVVEGQQDDGVEFDSGELL